jgi:surfactin synthase thioesterase subunit
VDGRPVLFFPPAGGDQTAVLPLVPLAAGMRLGALRVPGRGSRQEETAPTDLVALAERVATSVVALPGPPPVLVGHSFGGLVAYAVACLVEERGAAIGRFVAVASSSPPAWQRDVSAASAMAVEERTDRILARGALPPHIAADPELSSHARSLIATDVALGHHSLPLRPLTCPVTVVRGRDDTMVSLEATEGWASVTATPPAVITVPGGHFFYRSSPERLVNLLRMELSALDDAYAYDLR